MGEIEHAALVAVRDCLGIQPHESVLVLTDPPLAAIARVLADVARPLAREVTVAVTSRSITHTAARRAATAAGVRVATMPGITETCLIRTMNADYHAIAERTVRVTERLTRAATAHLSTRAGTDLTLPIADIAAIPSTGLLRERGRWGNLPSGEAYLRPAEGRTEGVLVVDGALAGIGTVAQPVRITIRGGLVTDVSGGAEAAAFSAMLDKAGPAARTVAELGVGTNDRAILTGKILEDEKILGTVHVAFGNNASMGGTVDIAFHVDGIVLRPTLTLDGEVLLRDGTPLFD